jgi:hypothetical protein
MPLPSETTNTNQEVWTEQEIKDLILYAKSLQQQVEDTNAKMIMMNAKLQNEEKKVIRLTNILKTLNIWQ